MIRNGEEGEDQKKAEEGGRKVKENIEHSSLCNSTPQDK